MMTLKVPYAVRNGGMVHISAVDSGLRTDCRCAGCHQALVAKKGKIVVHHFAHYGTAQCSGELVLHQLGKRILLERIQNALAKDHPLPVRWKCSFCEDAHSGDLLKKATSVLLEKSLDSFRPDLTLVGPGSKPIAALEVVVTHQPDAEAAEHYRKGGIRLVTFVVHEASDLEVLEKSEPLVATSIDICLRRKCPTCGQPVARRHLCILDVKCWKCRAPMKVALVEVSGSNVRGPDEFSGKEIALAERVGVILQSSFSATAQERYVANVCGRCRSFVGKHYFLHYCEELDAAKGEETGSECLDCGIVFDWLAYAQGPQPA